MPELPDVEYYRRYFNATALRQRIAHIHMHEPRLLEATSPQGLGRALKGRHFVSTQRHGKYLFAETDGDNWLVLHFGMSGELHYTKNGESEPEHTQFSIEFGNFHRLDYIAPRKLGHIALVKSPQYCIEAKTLGPDALAIDEETFVEQAAKRRGGIKAWLMDQHSLAGIGNLYSDEILFQCRLHPRTAVADLDDKDLSRIYRTTQRVLEKAIECKADPAQLPESFLLPHRHTGGLCPRCNGALGYIDSAGRTAWLCPGCQG